VIGGGQLSSTTLRPSITVNPPGDAKVSTLEVFGPVTCVYPFTRLHDAIAAANALPMAFQSSIFTEDLRTALDAAERLAASAVMVNDHTAFRADWMPFAGRRQSGYGRRRHTFHDAGDDGREDDRLQDVTRRRERAA